MFWRGMMTLKMSGAPLEYGPSYLVLLPTKLKPTVGQYRGRGPGKEHSGKAEQPMAERTYSEKPKGVAVLYQQ